MQNVVDQILDLAIEIQQIPAPTFAEAERAQFLHDLYLTQGLEDVEIDSAGNLYGCLKGDGNF